MIGCNKLEIREIEKLPESGNALIDMRSKRRQAIFRLVFQREKQSLKLSARNFA